ncbi:MAG TPA: hypothetical protein VH120_20895 [Gemmataceae bacterium]|nr:hypothetical protein [Gemmataceae bacterium]
MRQLRGRIAGALAAAALAAGPGCLSLDRKPIALSPDCAAACGEVPCACRGKTYAFLVSGFDPLDLDHVGDVRRALIQAGFTKIYNGQFYHDSFFAREMQRIRREEPEARFVVVGFSLGTEFAASLAESVGKQGVPVALLASVDPYWWSNAPTRKPDNVEQVLNVHGERLLFAPAMSPGSDVQIPGSFPANVTAHPLAVETVVRALATVAGNVPHTEPSIPAPDFASDQPTPRPVTRTDSPRDAWDFLKPMAKLPPLGPNINEERTSLHPVYPRLAE